MRIEAAEVSKRAGSGEGVSPPSGEGSGEENFQFFGLE